MSRNKDLAARVREVFLSGTWIANTNVKAQIQSVDWQQATQKIADLNSIALLTFHLNYYLNGLLQAFDTGKLDIHDKYSFDMPEMHAEQAWSQLIQDLLMNAEQFANAVEAMDDALFDVPFIDEKYGTYLRNIEGLIEHGYYHLGQMVLIRKFIAKNK